MKVVYIRVCKATGIAEKVSFRGVVNSFPLLDMKMEEAGAYFIRSRHIIEP